MIAGIDGGGTSTRLELRDDDNRLLERMSFGSFNITSLGAEAFRSRMREVIAAGGLGQARSLCIGGAGLTIDTAVRILHEELDAAGFHAPLMLCPDYTVALRGAMDGPGCILIAGTGSVGYGVNEAGETTRVGGHGHIIDDGGSGYALGRDALAAAARTLDGRAKAELLTAAVMEKLRLARLSELVNYVYSSDVGKAEIAAMASVVLDCASQGDAASMAILRSNAQELCLIVDAMRGALHMERPRVALLGGLIANDTVYRHVLTEALRPLCEVIEPAHDALWGAAQMAWEQLAKEKAKEKAE